MRFYDDLYISDVYKKKSKQIINDIKHKKMLIHTYLLIVSNNETMQLEIIHAAHLGQPMYQVDEFNIVGICCGYQDTLALVEHITKEVYEHTGGADVKSYLMGNKWND